MIRHLKSILRCPGAGNLTMEYRLTSLRAAIAKLLQETNGVLALRVGPGGAVAPHLFVKYHPEELENLAIWPKWYIPEALEVILRSHPTAKLGIVCRPCEEPRIVDVFVRARLNMDVVTVITLQCQPGEPERYGCIAPERGSTQPHGCPVYPWFLRSPGGAVRHPQSGWQICNN